MLPRTVLLFAVLVYNAAVGFEDFQKVELLFSVFV
jgi:hypothetical protein